ncbi:YggS family pyridoxal phosphate-dependent enzyme [Sphingomonas alba]|uniref:Pyridoxal phosphate homeostasis protein n=1 Tax=Sphingomonas alba TaxID=2908208 RepID=A0ABT0RME3_9SPHN|nr:YggS family pyridoxal phosphate-dependent enzyme [Sphingomonas alba]MCL6683817.1 YggS family pyridoxal phosphate-dependent enzyme [Sphingomonas alba]
MTLDSASRLAEIRNGIAEACKVARRKAEDVTLIAVTKGRSADQIEPLLKAGQRDFGESRVQEARAKWHALRLRYPDVLLHMIGQLQSNKADEAVALFDVIHSLDRPSLLAALVKAGEKAGRFPPVYVQVNIGAEDQKGGVAVAELGPFLDEVCASPLPLAGLMCIPPDEQQPDPYFALLAELARRHDVTGLSMGMSSDYKVAVSLGATAVRVGSALFEA